MSRIGVRIVVTLHHKIMRQVYRPPILLYKGGLCHLRHGLLTTGFQGDRPHDAAGSVGVLHEDGKCVRPALFPGSVERYIERFAPALMAADLDAVEIEGRVVIHVLEVERTVRAWNVA